VYGVMSVIALLGLVAITFGYYPLGPVERTTGTIVRIGGGAKGGVTAFVNVDHRRIQVKLPLPNLCVVGSPIHLLQQRRLWGLSVIPDWLPCDRTP
jgi:hypothetical protein